MEGVIQTDDVKQRRFPRIGIYDKKNPKQWSPMGPIDPPTPEPVGPVTP